MGDDLELMRLQRRCAELERERDALAKALERAAQVSEGLRARVRSLEAELETTRYERGELRAGLAEALRERDEARALKVPASTEELLQAQMAVATMRAERDVARAKALEEAAGIADREVENARERAAESEEDGTGRAAEWRAWERCAAMLAKLYRGLKAKP